MIQETGVSGKLAHTRQVRRYAVWTGPPQSALVKYATDPVRRRIQLMTRSARIATVFVWNIETIDAPVGVIESCAGPSDISSEASRLASTANSPSSAR